MTERALQRDRGDKERRWIQTTFLWTGLLPEDSSGVTVRRTGCKAFSPLYLVTLQSGLQRQSQTKPPQRARRTTLTGMTRCLQTQQVKSLVTYPFLWYQKKWGMARPFASREETRKKQKNKNQSHGLSNLISLIWNALTGDERSTAFVHKLAKWNLNEDKSHQMIVLIYSVLSKDKAL